MAAAISFSARAASAAEERGGVRGRVLDTANVPLQGASVRVDPGGLTAVTDREGNYLVGNLAPGAYKVQVSYIGFLTETHEAQVTSGAAVKVDLKLKPSVSLAEVVDVTASRSIGEVQAINLKKTTENIIDVLPAEIITSLPNANVADAIGRLPSVSLERDEGEGKYVQVRGLQPAYTNVTVNGVHVGASELAGGGRAVKLDDIPSDLVGEIVLSKTLSPDQDADAIGGSVNLVTKAARDENHFSLGTQQGYTFLQRGVYVQSTNGTFSGRFGENKALGVVIGGSYDYNARGIDDMEPAPGFITLPDGSSVTGLPSTDYREYSYNRGRFGFAGGLDYRLSPDSTIFLNGLFSNFHNFGVRWVNTPSAGNFLTPDTTDATGTFTKTVQNRRPNEVISSLAFGGKHVVSSVTVDYKLAYSYTRQNTDNQYQANFNGPSNIAYQIDNSNPNFPRFTVTNGVNINDPSQYQFSEFDISSDDTHLNSYEGQANVTVPFHLGDKDSVLKFGGKYREEDRTAVYNDFKYSANGSQNITLAQALESNFSNPSYYFSMYPLGPLINLTTAQNLFFANPGAFSVDSLGNILSHANNFTTTEKISAGYAMDTTHFGNLTVQVGVRIEYTNASYTGFKTLFDANGNYAGSPPTSGNQTYTDVDPNIQFRYAIDPSTNLRVVYGQAIARPDIVELVPTIYENDQNKQLAIGNPNLLPTHSRNADVLLEHYIGSVGLLSAGGFYKKLYEPIYGGAHTLLTSGPFAGFVQSQPINGPTAEVYGGEIAWQQRLSFLPGFWKGLGILANYTYTDSKATFLPSLGRSDTPRLARTTPHEANVNLTFDRGGFSLRGALTYNSATIFSYGYQDGNPGGITGPQGDTYIDAHTQIDAQASYMLKSGLRFSLSMLNINNQVFGFYNGSPHFNIQREFYGPTLFAGIALIK